MPRNMTLEEARRRLAERDHAGHGPDAYSHVLECATHACRNGVQRVHVLRRSVDGALLQELFTRDGVGTVMTATSKQSRSAADVLG